MSFALISVGAVLALITLPGTIELLALSLAGMLAPRRRMDQESRAGYRLAIVVPAHNEELHIARCVRSLLAADLNSIELQVVVVADNCTDGTEKAASVAGARVLGRLNAIERGKGYALDFAFRALLNEGWNAFAVVDADSEVARNFVTELVASLEAGADAVQCRYLVRNAKESARTRVMAVALSAFNVLRPRGRDRLGISSGIYGNGFALRAATLREVPYSAASVVEDLEYHLALVRAGKRVRFVDSTAVFGDMPAEGSGVETQRSRWEGGRLRMLRERVPGLLRDVLSGNLRMLEPCLDLLLLPLAFHVLFLSMAAATPFLFVRAIALLGLAAVAFHLMAAIRVTGGGLKEVAALASAPLYIAWKVLLIPRLIKTSFSGSAWVRTERAANAAATRNIP